MGALARGLHGHPVLTLMALLWDPASAGPDPVTAQLHSVAAGNVRALEWRSPTVPGMEAGLPGPPGLPAAPLVALASRCGSAPAATLRPGMEGVCAWARTGRKDTAMNIYSAHHTCSGQAGDLGNAAQPSAGVAFKLAVGPVKMGLTVQDAMWNTSLVTPMHAQS